jgi:tyramine---L-glutamate ligase
MRQEGAAMLRAAALDLLYRAGARVTILLAQDVACPVPTHRNVLIHQVGLTVELQSVIAGLARTADKVLIIAPESDGILQRLLKVVESEIDSNSVLLNLGSEPSAIFCDKLETFHWLRSAGLPTPLTHAVTEEQAGRILRESPASRGQCDLHTRSWILKPRDGVGSDRIHVVSEQQRLAFGNDKICPITEDPQRLPSLKAAPWILQRRLAGTAVSIGVIGRGSGRAPEILPVVEQRIECGNGVLRYAGGNVPARAPLGIAVSELASSFGARLNRWSGYVGIDLICDSMSGDVQGVVDVNPRLCTSFVGYSNLTDRTATGSLLSPASGSPVFRNCGIHFDCKGDIVESPGESTETP